MIRRQRDARLLSPCPVFDGIYVITSGISSSTGFIMVLAAMCHMELPTTGNGNVLTHSQAGSCESLIREYKSTRWYCCRQHVE